MKATLQLSTRSSTRSSTIGMLLAIVGLELFCGAGCVRRARAPEQQRTDVQEKMKRLIDTRLAEWQTASVALQQAAPLPAGRGWDAHADAPAIAAMRAAWARGRTAYELVEGAVAPLFPESDLATDARYEYFLAPLGSAGDPDPFDARGVVGMHAIERVLWANAIPPDVVAFESVLPGFRKAAFPATAAEARAFKQDLVGRVVTDVRALGADLATLEIDVAFAFRGLVDLALEQKEKVDKAATGEEESRYAQATMRDLRANMRGCRDAYDVFRPWVLATHGGDAVDARVTGALARLDDAYAAVAGDAIPRPPTTWSSLNPRAGDRDTAFGRLFTAVEHETNPQGPQSLVTALGAVADQLELPRALFR
jgi:iron uptake system component EfeO